MAAILKYLDKATALLPPSPGLESDAAWNIRMARERLYDAAIVDIVVETIPPAANDSAPVRRAA